MSAKTHKGLSKRFKRSASGKVMRRASGKRHLMSHKPAKRARRLRGWRRLARTDQKSLERQYGKL
ncbi:MAG: 50S ribosomal protein L35 [Planctomycetota bacterium]|jgi:large subunit ribosomal protein L35